MLICTGLRRARLILFLQQSSVEWCSSLWMHVVQEVDPEFQRTARPRPPCPCHVQPAQTLLRHRGWGSMLPGGMCSLWVPRGPWPMEYQDLCCAVHMSPNVYQQGGALY